MSSGGLSPEEGAQKLVAYLQGISLNGNTAQSSPQDFRPSHSQSQPSTGSTPSPSKPLGVNQGQGKQGSGTLAGPDSLLGTVQSDMEVPAPRKRMTGEEKLRSWLTNGVQVPPPPRGQPAVAVNGFSNNPAGKNSMLTHVQPCVRELSSHKHDLHCLWIGLLHMCIVQACLKQIAE